MAEIVGLISSVAGLVSFTDLLVSNITGLVRAVGEVPTVISSLRGNVAVWQLHLDALHGLGQRQTITQHLKAVLNHTGLLTDAGTCLKRLNDIIVGAVPPGRGQSRPLELWDQFKLSRKQSEMESLLKRMDRITVQLQTALATNTALVFLLTRISRDRH